MLMLNNAAITQKGKLWVKDGRRTRTTRRVKVAPRVAPPSGWQPKMIKKKFKEFYFLLRRENHNFEAHYTYGNKKGIRYDSIEEQSKNGMVF